MGSVLVKFFAGCSGHAMHKMHLLFYDDPLCVPCSKKVRTSKTEFQAPITGGCSERASSPTNHEQPKSGPDSELSDPETGLFAAGRAGGVLLHATGSIVQGFELCDLLFIPSTGCFRSLSFRLGRFLSGVGLLSTAEKYETHCRNGDECVSAVRDQSCHQTTPAASGKATQSRHLQPVPSGNPSRGNGFTMPSGSAQ